MTAVIAEDRCKEIKNENFFESIRFIVCWQQIINKLEKIMTKKSIILGILSLTIAGTAMYALRASAYWGDAMKNGSNYSPERHEQMEKAFEKNDYNAWKNLMNGRGRVSDVINEGNFNRFAEAHKLMEEGKTDEANKIRQEFGLGQGGKNGQDMNNGQKEQNKRGNFVDANGDRKCDRIK
jgi:hypothetical protein